MYFFPPDLGLAGGGSRDGKEEGGSQSGWQELKEMKSKKTIIGDSYI